jgi:putative ATP-binding cassette transporter
MAQDSLQIGPYTTWKLIKAYWQSEHWVIASVFLAVVILFTGALVGLEVLLNFWYEHFYNALQAYDKQGTIDLVGMFMFIAGIFIIVSVYRYYLQQILGLRWRRWLTNQFLTRWLGEHSYYYLEVFYQGADNPDQRIQEDIASVVSLSLSLLIGLIGSIATFFAFIYILWNLSGNFSISLGSLGVFHIPGYLVWAAIIYAMVGTYFTMKIGSPLPGLNFEQQRREADFRFSAVDLRAHAEDVALYHGESYEKKSLSGSFNRVIDIWYSLIVRQKKLLWFTAGYNQLSVIIPLIVVLPNYFSKFFKLGALMQSLKAFGQVQDALSYLINSYTTIAEWRAVNRRLVALLNHMHEIKDQAAIENKFQYKTQPQARITVKELALYTPKKEKLLSHINQEFLQGHHYFIRGASGLGKSTFVRALAAIWPYGEGEIILPEGQKIMYLPQKPFMPIGSLRDALLFPDKDLPVSDDVIKSLLSECGLSELENRLHEVGPWSQQLSPGEQQRIAIIRVLLQKPDWIFLDESTSALDLAYEKQMYDLLKSKLPRCSLISVGHRPSLEQYHDVQVDFTQYGEKLSEL